MSQSTAERHTCISIYDPENPDSVWSRLPESGREAMDKVPPYLKTWSFKKIEKTYLHKFTIRDRIFKLAFWREYEHAIDHNKAMSLAAICRGVCPDEYMREHIFTSGAKMAWILYPGASYENNMMEMLDLSTRRLREVLEIAPINRKTNSVDYKLATLQLKIHELVENRVRGVAPQIVNINQRSLNMNLNKNSDALEPAEDLQRLSLPEINDRLLAIQNEMKTLPDEIQKPPKKTIIKDQIRKKSIDGEYYNGADPDVIDAEATDVK